MKKETVEKGQSLLNNIAEYTKIIMELDADVRKDKEKVPISRISFLTLSGTLVASVSGEPELIEILTKIVVREYNRRVLDMENKLDAL